MASTPSSLAEWAQSHLTSLYESNPSSTATDEAQAASPTFDAVFSPKAEIVVNHDALARDTLKANIAQKQQAAQRCDVAWKDVIEVPKDADKPHEAGIVAGTLVVTHSMKFRIRAAPAQHQTFITFNAKIDQDPSVDADAHGDRRRIVHLFQTTLDKSVPIHFSKPGNKGASD